MSEREEIVITADDVAEISAEDLLGGTPMTEDNQVPVSDADEAAIDAAIFGGPTDISENDEIPESTTDSELTIETEEVSYNPYETRMRNRDRS